MRPGKASRNPEEVAGRKWPAVQAGVVLRSGPGLKVDLWRNPSFNFGDAGLDWFQTQLLIVNATRSQDQTIEKAWVGFPFLHSQSALWGWAPTAQLDPETSGF